MYHKIIDNNGNVIGISGPDENNIQDENWIEITEEEYREIEKNMENQGM